jgi:hypothetical protein
LKEGTRGNTGHEIVSSKHAVVVARSRSRWSRSSRAVVRANVRESWRVQRRFRRQAVDVDALSICPGEPYEQPDAKRDGLKTSSVASRRCRRFARHMHRTSSRCRRRRRRRHGHHRGRPAEKGKEVGISVIGVTPHFNPTMGLPIVEGVTSRRGRLVPSPVAIINRQ